MSLIDTQLYTGTMDETVAKQDSFDLHVHSSVSDGTETPAEVVDKAHAIGLTGLALTDHDTALGWAEASETARKNGIVFVPGMELSARCEWRSVHVLAYLFDPSHDELSQEIDRIREARLKRAQIIVDRIGADYALEWDDVLAHSRSHTTIGRPHIADALIARGHVSDRTAAFAGILHPASGYYEPYFAPSPLQAIQLVRAAGGVPVLAHPATAGRESVMSEDHFRPLVEAGLFGLEVEHRENTPEGKERLRELAKKFGLVMTGSSDYHGAGKQNRLGENVTDRPVVARIIAEASGVSPLNWEA